MATAIPIPYPYTLPSFKEKNNKKRKNCGLQFELIILTLLTKIKY